MDITIDWPYFLGIMGGIIMLAWYTNGRFTALETSMSWVKEILKEVKTTSDNAATPVFGAASPVNLNNRGEQWLVDSGLKDFIDSYLETLIEKCEYTRQSNPYEVQRATFKIMDEYAFPSEIDAELKKFAFEKGSTMNIIRRVAGIYLRNLCLDRFQMSREDIDKHDPEIS